MAQFLTPKSFQDTGLVTAITSEGNRFYAQFDEVFTTGETKYFLYQMPGNGHAIALIKRLWQSLNGSAEISILWDSTGVVPGTPIYILNENRNSNIVSGVEISEIAAPTTDGLVIETDFLTGTGQGSNSSGDISPESGFRLYSPSSFFIAKVTNLENSDNRIKLGYNFARIPLTALG